ncbi:MAG TPA: hypothetical protein PKZ78_12605, partial [Candidatus Goldiibacteriota bacterium]|nr:hypothetical protein [Candidatus Goldiibacteriota bacterium]
RGCLMQRRQIRMSREFPIANDVNIVLISRLFTCKNANLGRALKKYTQPLQGARDRGTEGKTN